MTTGGYWKYSLHVSKVLSWPKKQKALFLQPDTFADSRPKAFFSHLFKRDCFTVNSEIRLNMDFWCFSFCFFNNLNLNLIQPSVYRT